MHPILQSGQVASRMSARQFHVRIALNYGYKDACSSAPLPERGGTHSRKDVRFTTAPTILLGAVRLSSTALYGLETCPRATPRPRATPALLFSKSLPYMTQDTTPPPNRFLKLGYSAPSVIPIPNHTFSESCSRDLSNGALIGAVARLAVECLSFEIRSHGCVILRHRRYNVTNNIDQTPS